MRLLVIEDDPKTAAYLRKGLVENSYVVDLAADGSEGLHFALAGTYDAIVLDMMLPEKTGWQVLRELRGSGRATPVICLTARDGVEDRVRGLDLGADDYLVKPFAFTELLARIRSVVRRGPTREAETVRVGDLEMDLLRRRATRAGVRLDLTPKEFALLALLARHAGQPMSRTVIAEQVWDMNFDSDSNVVDVHVRRLRAKVDEPFGAPLVHTLRGVGYVLEAGD